MDHQPFIYIFGLLRRAAYWSLENCEKVDFMIDEKYFNDMQTQTLLYGTKIYIIQFISYKNYYIIKSGDHWAAKHDFTFVSVNGLSHDTSDIHLLNFKMSIANGDCFKSCEIQELSPLL